MDKYTNFNAQSGACWAFCLGLVETKRGLVYFENQKRDFFLVKMFILYAYSI